METRNEIGIFIDKAQIYYYILQYFLIQHFSMLSCTTRIIGCGESIKSFIWVRFLASELVFRVRFFKK